jgi:membrane protein
VGSVEDAVQGVVGDSRQTRYVRYLLKRAQEDQIAQVAGSLTYTTLLSLVPFLTIALGLFSAFPIFDQLRDALEEFMIDNLLPAQASDAVMTHIADFTSKAAGLTAAGVFALAVTAVLMMQTIDRAFNAIWRVPRPRPLAQRVLVYWAAVSLGPLLIGGGLVITSYVVSASLGWLPGGHWIAHLILAALPVGLTMLAFTLLYVAVPNRDVQWKHAAIGGGAAAAAFELMKVLFGAYIARFPTYTLIYGAFAAIPIFLLWVYLSWVVTLAGGLIAATWPLLGYERGETRKWPGSSFTDAMRILALLHKSRAKGGATPRQIRAELRAGFSDSETLMEQMRDAGWVARVQGVAGEARWAMLCEPDAVRVADVFRRFAFDPALAMKKLDADETALGASVENIAGLIDGSLDLTLKQAFETLATTVPLAEPPSKRTA